MRVRRCDAGWEGWKADRLGCGMGVRGPRIGHQEGTMNAKRLLCAIASTTGLVVAQPARAELLQRAGHAR